MLNGSERSVLFFSNSGQLAAMEDPSTVFFETAASRKKTMSLWKESSVWGQGGNEECSGGLLGRQQKARSAISSKNRDVRIEK